MDKERDEKFRENCQKISKDYVDCYFNDVKIGEGEARLESLKAAALLYIAANMPSLEENDVAKREQQGCAFCNSGKDEQQLIDNSFEKICIDSKLKAITLENKRQFYDSSKVVSSVIGSFPIAYCPVCGRKL